MQISVSTGKKETCYLVILCDMWFVCRLDFDQFVLMGPENQNNICSNDQFLVSGSTPIPLICGINTGNHSKFDI